MRLTLLLCLFLSTAQIPKNDPTGTWEAESGSRFSMKLSGSDLKVKIVPESNARFLDYDLDLKVQEEKNTYKGTGYFVAKMKTGKECRFETEWQIVVVTLNRIIGVVKIGRAHV